MEPRCEGGGTIRGLSADPIAVVLATVNGTEGEGPQPGVELDVEGLHRAIELAWTNGLYYAFLKRYLAAGGHFPQDEASRWAAQNRSIADLRASLDALADTAQDTGIDYIVIKDVQTVEHVPRDLDIFVPEADRPAFLEGLQSKGFSFAYNDGAEISLARPASMRVDVYSRIHYLGKDFLDDDYLLRSVTPIAVHDRAVPGLTPEAAFLLNSVHAIFGHGSITLLDFLDLENLLALTGDPERLRRGAASFGWERAFELWSEYLARIQATVSTDHRPYTFPHRLESRFVVAVASSLAPSGLSLRNRALLRLSLLWDRALFVAETSGLEDTLRRSSVARSVANSAGHRIRFVRGDRKSTVRALKRIREET